MRSRSSEAVILGIAALELAPKLDPLPHLAKQGREIRMTQQVLPQPSASKLHHLARRVGDGVCLEALRGAGRIWRDAGLNSSLIELLLCFPRAFNFVLIPCAGKGVLCWRSWDWASTRQLCTPELTHAPGTRTRETPPQRRSNMTAWRLALTSSPLQSPRIRQTSTFHCPMDMLRRCISAEPDLDDRKTSSSCVVVAQGHAAATACSPSRRISNGVMTAEFNSEASNAFQPLREGEQQQAEAQRQRQSLELCAASLSKTQVQAYAVAQEMARILLSGISDERSACESWRKRAKRLAKQSTGKEVG